MSLSRRLSGHVFVARAVRAARHAGTRRQQALERDLAGFTSPSEIRDLQATLDRYPDAEAGELREILARRAQRRPRPWPAMRGL